MVTKPSIRSKLLQILLGAYAPKISAKSITPINATKTAKSELNRGRTWVSNKHRISHAAKIISTTILKKKTFPVTKGKNNELLIIRGVSKTRKRLPKSDQRKTDVSFITKGYQDFRCNGTLRVRMHEHLAWLYQIQIRDFLALHTDH